MVEEMTYGLTKKPKSLFKLSTKTKNMSAQKLHLELMKLELSGVVKQYAPKKEDRDLGSPLNSRWGLK